MVASTVGVGLGGTVAVDVERGVLVGLAVGVLPLAEAVA
jgi:hypothetical protein